MIGSCSKLTRTVFFFFFPYPSSDAVSDAALDAGLLNPRPLGARGELLRLETEGEDFKADLAGDMERGKGSCFKPASSIVLGAKVA
jgi:hypothetical protein